MKCVIFDMDGTIADTLPLCIAAFRKSIERLSGIKLTDKEITNTFGPSEEGTIKTFLPEKYEEGVELYLKYYEELHPTMCPEIFQGILDLLSYLKDKGIKIGLVTGKGRKSLDISLRIFELEGWFYHIETGSPEGNNKARGIQKVLDACSISPNEAIYIGDTVSDIISSREVSVPIISAAWAKSTNAVELEHHKPDYLFQEVEELLQWFKERNS
jgi:HAD superfamily hydrolase (TIGR01549 family)